MQHRLEHRFENADWSDQDVVCRDRETAIVRAEQELAKVVPAFLKDVLQDVGDMMNICAVALASGMHSPQEAGDCKSRILVTVSHLMEVCQSYGFGFAGQISTSLYEILSGAVTIDPALVKAMECHLVMLETVFNEGIKGDGGESGEAILKALRHIGEHLED